MKKQTRGSIVNLDGEPFYKIENYDFMSDFFMTITSSSDVWNFLWSHGGISAGRKNSDFSIFPYCTSDKIQDTKTVTGPVTLIRIRSDGFKGTLWQPFENLSCRGRERYADNLKIQRNLYKNMNGSKIWFEEVNLAQGLVFRYGWTSSAKYGLVKMSRIENLTEKKIPLEILDGCQNIMASSTQAEIQNSKSNLLNAYKKSEVVNDGNIAIFGLSSILTDRAEPSESLNTNVSWFSTNEPVILSENAVQFFVQNKTSLLEKSEGLLNGRRGECYIIRRIDLAEKSAECWEQILDVDYDIVKLVELQSEIQDRKNATRLLLSDIQETERKLERNIQKADGLQRSKNRIADLHHRTNVMFNIMRGGLFKESENLDMADFKDFCKKRNTNVFYKIENFTEQSELDMAADDPNVARLSSEYLPLTFSRRHGDPSRPWNRFNIDLQDKNGGDRTYYEGNWRDIFQNWEALLWSFPAYTKNVISVFINAMTLDGYNPYRISRNGIDWEVPESGNPWAQYGYWGDHQVVYLQKFLEFYRNLDCKALLEMLNEKNFSTANIPYRLKSYSEILKNPRSSLFFDHSLDASIKNLEKNYGTDARLVLDDSGKVMHTTMATKLIQIVLAKLLNLIPDAGIWLNTQRPEWNDANNALAGYGTSVVTLCHLYRMLSFLKNLLHENDVELSVQKTVYETLTQTLKIYSEWNEKNRTEGKSNASKCEEIQGGNGNCAEDEKRRAQRKEFLDRCGKTFEEERRILFKDAYTNEYVNVHSKTLSEYFSVFLVEIENSVRKNRRADGLYNSYNTVKICDGEISVINLKLMLEGQVAALSSGILSKEETLELAGSLRKSALFEENQHSYMLYPNETLPRFTEKNNIHEKELSTLKDFLNRTENTVIKKDRNGIFHFNSIFRNAETLENFLERLSDRKKPNETERNALLSLYEKKFTHQTFTGRSGTFYAYEGLGCIYWHLVSKLLLAVQENLEGSKDRLYSFYKDVKKGLSSAKTPFEYGAFPFDPYSHTPYRLGAQQPGMTGQVKEEIIARFMELGVKIQDGSAVFNPTFLEKTEFEDGKIEFSWCGTKIEYVKDLESCVKVVYSPESQKTFTGRTLPPEESRMFFSRSGKIKTIIVGLSK